MRLLQCTLQQPAGPPAFSRTCLHARWCFLVACELPAARDRPETAPWGRISVLYTVSAKLPELFLGLKLLSLTSTWHCARLTRERDQARAEVERVRAAAPTPAEVANGGGAEAAEEQPAKRVRRARVPHKADPRLMRLKICSLSYREGCIV